MVSRNVIAALVPSCGVLGLPCMLFVFLCCSVLRVGLVLLSLCRYLVSSPAVNRRWQAPVVFCYFVVLVVGNWGRVLRVLCFSL